MLTLVCSFSSRGQSHKRKKKSSFSAGFFSLTKCSATHCLLFFVGPFVSRFTYLPDWSSVNTMAKKHQRPPCTGDVYMSREPGDGTEISVAICGGEKKKGKKNSAQHHLANSHLHASWQVKFMLYSHAHRFVTGFYKCDPTTWWGGKNGTALYSVDSSTN